jgi:predicted HicB family RNase H-like nuclease
MKTKSNPVRHYTKLVEWSDEDKCFVGTCPELMLGGVHGADEAEVYRELCQVVEEVIALKESKGDELPEPLSAQNFSGKFILRVDPKVHRLLALRAKARHESLNVYCANRLVASL